MLIGGNDGMGAEKTCPRCSKNAVDLKSHYCGECFHEIHDSRPSVNHPAHYNIGKIEVIEFIEDQKLGYHEGNAVKYVCRAGRKDPTKLIEDLQKAIWYLKRRIEIESGSPRRPNEMNTVNTVKQTIPVQTEFKPLKLEDDEDCADLFSTLK